MFKKVRNWKVALTLTLIIAIANLPLQYLAYRFFYVEPYLASLPEAIRNIANYEPFFNTWYGGATIGVWLALIALWTWHLHAKRKVTINSKKLSTALAVGFLCFILGLTLFHLQLARCEWNTYRQVDVLMIGDEEFHAQPSWITNAENVLEDVSDDRFDQSHINFYVRGWLAWDSADGVTSSYDLMQEALAESGMPRQQVEIVPGFWDWGFISGSEWTDDDGVKWWIDLLLIFTGQNMDIKGLSPPMCNTTIIHHDHVNLHTLTHELGHQYYLQHCGDPWCVMNVDWQFGDNFCSGCRAALTSHNSKWLTDPEIFVGCDDEKGEIVKPGAGFFDYGFLWWLARVKCGTTLTIRAEAKEGWFFDHYYGINAPFIFTQDPDDPPPPSFTRYEQEFDFTFSDTWTITAWFVPGRYLTLSTVGRGTTNPSSSGYYRENTTATITAIPDTGYAFKYWKLDGVTYTSNPINVYMGLDHTLQAYFTQDYRLQVEIYNGDGTTNLAVGEYWFYEGTEVTITATPSTGYRFTCWIVDGDYDILLTLQDRLCLAFGANYANPITVTMNSNHVVSVVFNPTVVLFPVYNNDGEWLANDCTIAYRRSGQIIIDGKCHGNYPWQYDFFEIDQDARDDGKFTIDVGGGVTFSCDITLLPAATFEYYNYATILPSGTYDFLIQCPGYQTKYYYNIEIPADESYFIGFWTVILQEFVTGGCSGDCIARLCVC